MLKTTYPHHAQSIDNMIAHYGDNDQIQGLFLIGSVATGTERPDSDIDGVAVVSDEYYAQKRERSELEEVYKGKCTYEGGYFNIHYVTRGHLEEAARTGTEPVRNSFVCAKLLFGSDPGLAELAGAISTFPKGEAEAKKLRFYCGMKMLHTYFWTACKPKGFMRFHAAGGIVYNLYRLILLENEILFPSVRKLEDSVIRAPNKPERIVEKCGRFMQSLADEDCAELVKCYEAWTAYDYPKDHGTVMNCYSNPYELL